MMSRTNDTVYEEQCRRWHNDLLPSFEANNTYNLNERLDEIEKIVNRECSQYYDDPFLIPTSQRHNLQTLCNKDIGEHTMVSHTKCTKQILDIDEYKKKARNKLNRWKPKVFGEHVLFEIIFINLYNVCNTRHTAQQQHSRKSTQTKHCITIGRCRRFEWDDVRINRLFVSVFVELLDAKIRFKKTRDVPLILATAFSTNTRFRSSCIYFLRHFNELSSWDHTIGTAVQRRNSFRQRLDTIRSYDEDDDIAIPPPIIIDMMDVKDTNRECDAVYLNVIRQWIIHLEQSMHPDERISHDMDCIRLICEYHHNTLHFWTVTPTKPPSNDCILIQDADDVVSAPDITTHSEHVQPFLSYNHCRGSPNYGTPALTVSTDSYDESNQFTPERVNYTQRSQPYYGHKESSYLTRANTCEWMADDGALNDRFVYSQGETEYDMHPHITHPTPHYSAINYQHQHIQQPLPPQTQHYYDPPPPPVIMNHPPRSYEPSAGDYQWNRNSHNHNNARINESIQCNTRGCCCGRCGSHDARMYRSHEEYHTPMQVDSQPNVVYHYDKNAQQWQTPMYNGSGYVAPPHGTHNN
eukprot:459947_1